ILILNGTTDRETDGYTALDFIGTITNALNESQLIDARRAFYDSHTEEDSTFYSRPVNYGFRQWPPLYRLRTSCGLQEGYTGANSPRERSTGASTPFPPELVPNEPPSRYITHLIYLSNSQVPVDREAIGSLGIQCVVADPDPNSEEPRYHPGLLQKVLSEILFKDKQP
ncbi:hypothetical protein CU097_001034, partial [Rhizopus azygosporus]